jgi:cytochrome c oxidase subunit 2
MSPEQHDKREEIAEEVTPIFKGGPFFKRPAGKILIIWVPMTIIGVLIGIFVPKHILPREMSPQFGDAKATIVFFTVMAAPVAAFVYAVGAYSLIAWRKRGPTSDTPPPDGPPLRGSSLASGIWIGVSVLLVVVLLVWGMGFLASEDSPQTNVLQVNVTGQQWLWTFSYPGTGVTTHQLVLPEGRQIQFNITSLDVTHGFWPVELGTQVDANPGFITHIVVDPNQLGTFDVRCSQLCGLYHAYMYTTGKVVTSAQFTSWLQSEGASTSSVSSYALGAS